MRRTVRWIGLGLGGLLARVFVLGLGLYWFGPNPVTATATAEIAAPPDVVFDTFTTYAAWGDLWDVIAMTPPAAPAGVGSTFDFIESDGTVANGTITQHCAMVGESL